MVANDASDLRSTLLGIVAEKTGYPLEILNPDMELEADLGIDSIKRVEILAALNTAAPCLPEVDTRELGRLRTLRAILDRLDDSTETAATASLAVVSSESNKRVAPSQVSRSGIREVDAPASGIRLRGIGSGARVAIVGDDSGLREALIAELNRAGVATIPELRAEAEAVIVLSGLAPATDPASVVEPHLEAFAAARSFAPIAAERGGGFVVVQDTGGDFGLSWRAGDRAWLSGFSGLAKTAAWEWPKAMTKAIDLERGSRTPKDLAAVLVSEFFNGGPEIEIGLHENEHRTTLREIAFARPHGNNERLSGRPVLIASGGGRGIAAIRGTALNSGAAIQRRRNLTLEEAAHSGEEDGLTLYDRHVR